MRKQLRELLKTIESAEQDPKDIVPFSKSFFQAVQLNVFTVADAATEFRVSVGTVNRWRLGQSAPHPLGRPSVLQWLKKKNKRKARSVICTANTKPQNVRGFCFVQKTAGRERCRCYFPLSFWSHPLRIHSKRSKERGQKIMNDRAEKMKYG